MKQLAIGVTIGALLGVLLGYWLFYKKSEVFSLTQKDLQNTLTFNFTNPDKKKGTDTISYENAIWLASNFVKKLHNSPTDPNNLSNKFVSWPNELKGWIVDSKKLQKFIIEQNGQSPLCNNIFIELGYDSLNHQTTLILTGVQSFTGPDGKIVDKRIYLKKDAADRGVNSVLANNYILEYVDPCVPRCPK